MPQVFPETEVYYVVGTNIAFLTYGGGQKWLADQADECTLLAMPAGLLAEGTKIVYGDRPEHKPAIWPEAAEKSVEQQDTN